MLFCPTCGTMLQISLEEGGIVSCLSCPYVQMSEGACVKKLEVVPKVADDIMGGPEQWANVDTTKAQCPHCEHTTAYFKQLQVRSADEPMTNFYKCVKCGGNWNE